MSDNIKVAVRVRPFNTRETDIKSKLVVRMEDNTTFLINPETGKERSFAFDYSIWSNDSKHDNFVSQREVFDKLGTVVIDNAFEGYNCTVFAYGQTGSGKSFTMVGEDNTDESFRHANGEMRGLVPRLCEAIFDRVNASTDKHTTFSIEASMMEIYNEKLHDLLNPAAYGRGHGSAGELRIRESPTLGPYVENLTVSAVQSFDDLMQLMATGTRHRTIGATSMNRVSSRAHTIFTIIVTQTTVDKDRMKAMDKVSRINLVDLAGSERQGKAESTGDRLKEGCAINKSLSALGHCITLIANGATDDLAETSYSSLAGGPNNKSRNKTMSNSHIPYRDSVLTWLLSESLGGNAKTIMIATISPSDFNYAESLSTLRYAWQAKQIKTRAVVNEDPNETLIRELRAEIELLRRRLAGEDISNMDDTSQSMIREQLKHSEEMISHLNKTWEQRLKETEEKLRGSTVLQPMDGAIDAKDMRSIQPYLLNLHEDSSLTKHLAFPIVRFSVFGVDPQNVPPPPFVAGPNDEVHQVTLKGVGIRGQHAVIEANKNRIFISAVENARVCVNGSPLAANERKEITHNDRVIMGMNHVFVVCCSKDTSTTPRHSTPADFTMAMEEMLAGMQQKFFDPSEQQRNQAELDAKWSAIREKENALELERQKYQQMLLEIESEYKQFNRRRDNKVQSRMDELETRLTAENRLDDLEEERQKLLNEIEEEDINEITELDSKKQRVIQQQLEVDSQLQSQNERIRVFKAAKEKEQRDVARAEEDIMHLIPLVDEANLMAQQMNKTVNYEVRLQSAVSPEIFEDPITGQTMHKSHVEAAVTVTDTHSHHKRIWNYDKFMTRLYLMREAFEMFQNTPDYSVDKDIDPFFDQGEAEEIGKAHLWLMGITHFIDSEDCVPIISKTGVQQGKLNVRVLLADHTGKPSNAPYRSFSSIEKLVGHRLDLIVEIPSCQGMNPNAFTEVFARFRFFNENSYTETKPCSKASASPQLRFRKHITLAPVDPSFVSFLSTDALTVEIWGTANKLSQTKPDTSPKIEAATPTPALKARPKSVWITRPKSQTLTGPIKSIQSAKTLTMHDDDDNKKVADDVALELEMVKAERDLLAMQLQAISAEAQRIESLESRLAQLELENANLRSAIESSGTKQKSGVVRTSSKSASSATTSSSSSTHQRTMSVGTGSARDLNGKKSPRITDADIKTSAARAKERLEAMKKKFGDAL